MKKFISVISMLFIVAMFVVSCGGNSNNAATADNAASKSAVEANKGVFEAELAKIATATTSKDWTTVVKTICSIVEGNAKASSEEIVAAVKAVAAVPATAEVDLSEEETLKFMINMGEALTKVKKDAPELYNKESEAFKATIDAESDLKTFDDIIAMGKSMKEALAQLEQLKSMTDQTKEQK